MALPWYSRIPDIAHRLTVVGLVGFTVYMTAGVSWTLYQNGKIAEERIQKQKEIMEKQNEQQ
ncbi:Cox14 protein [Martiniozyma asiatica (nom. inval.)]|nr:Cox14 protein [Martiniozyma asiatica]